MPSCFIFSAKYKKEKLKTSPVAVVISALSAMVEILEMHCNSIHCDRLEFTRNN